MTRDQPAVRAEDWLPVRSRVSAVAILAGAFVAFAIFILLSTLAIAIELSTTDSYTVGPLQTGGTFWAIVTTFTAFFAGGWVTSQCTGGNTRLEAVFYGVILWSLLFTVLVYLAISGVLMGFNSLLDVASFTRVKVEIKFADIARVSKEVGMAESQIEEFLERLGHDVNRRNAASAAWWALAGMLSSMFAAVAGALVGTGRNPLSRLAWFMGPHPPVPPPTPHHLPE